MLPDGTVTPPREAAPAQAEAKAETEAETAAEAGADPFADAEEVCRRMEEQWQNKPEWNSPPQEPGELEIGEEQSPLNSPWDA